MTAKLALQQRRIAVGAERIAARRSRTNYPWTDRNVRVWQAVAGEAHAERRRILREYLERRKVR